MMAKHKTFFGKIFGSAWDAVKGFVQTAFDNANHDFLQAAISITEQVKNILSSGTLDVFTDLIPGDIDQQIVDKLRDMLPKILADELLLSSLNAESTEKDVQDVAKKILDGFGVLPADRVGQFLTSIAAKIYIALQDGTVTFGEAAMLAEAAYQTWSDSKP